MSYNYRKILEKEEEILNLTLKGVKGWIIHIYALLNAVYILNVLQKSYIFMTV